RARAALRPEPRDAPPRNLAHASRGGEVCDVAGRTRCPAQPGGGTMLDISTLSREIEAFNARGQTGADPVAQLYRERRKQWSLFTPRLSDEGIEALRPYIFCYDRLPEKADDQPIPLRNFIGGEWRPETRTVVMHEQVDRRVRVCELHASDENDAAAAHAVAEDYWASLD